MLSPAEFVLSYAQIGAKKCSNSLGRLFLLAVLAGAFIAAGAVAASTAACGLENVSVARVVSGLLFPFGLIMVVITGAELFTGNCLITISLLEKKAALTGMIRNLTVVYLGNLLGAAALAAAMAYSGAFSNSALAVYAIRTAANKCALPFGQGVVLGILCNILVCAGVMCALCGKSVASRAVGAFVPVSFFVIGGFEHCVANMYHIPAGLLAAGLLGHAELTQAAGANLSALDLSGLLCSLVSVTLGNIIGGCGFGALIWAGHRPSEGYGQST